MIPLSCTTCSALHIQVAPNYGPEVMSSESIFRARLVISVGEEPTSLARVREYLAWSRSRLIDIYILRRMLSPTSSPFSSVDLPNGLIHC
ncbi:uncharacterized protein B0H18DRAFT_121022 [Fomitopsis serialis]|uniref:uncharacterized protein n=1 Tax=Fomitopsis serialis TaxID=139415 RepID=UPI002007DFDA|nr:uncharacterized protein B0H18DRAFT_121022 [Neoantrodia serialis]KAH9930999.1 hypothetical protein B0H18DRAFT_121022 [Neoantrodia serialis]